VVSLETLREIKVMTEENRTVELPTEVPEPVWEDMISPFVAKWEEIAIDWFAKVEKASRECVISICTEHFKRASTALRTEARYRGTSGNRS
jgi:hypothetical protein